jgi:hypothetical protein
MDICLFWDLCVCDWLITRQEVSYRLWCVRVWSRNLKTEETKSASGL